MNDIKEEKGHWKLKRSTRLHCVESLLWKRFWTCRKTTEWMNHMWFLCAICVCVIMKILLQICLILDTLYIQCSDIQSVLVYMCLLYWTETPFCTWVLYLSMCLTGYPCGVSVLTVPYFSVQLGDCWHQTLSIMITHKQVQFVFLIKLIKITKHEPYCYAFLYIPLLINLF